MKNIRSLSRTALLFTFFCFTLALLSACQPRHVVKAGKTEGLSIKKIVVLPVTNMYTAYGEGVNFRCPICSGSFLVGDVEPGADEFLTQQIYGMLRSRGGVDFISPEQAMGIQSSLLFNSEKELSELELVMRTGKKVEAQAVVLGRVYRFVERIGTGYSAESPASVSFNLMLINPEDGSLIWEGHFTETQRSLSENLLDIATFFKRNMKWLTARELAVSGLEDVLQTFPLQ
jgi:hypothetical protein